MKKKLIKSNFNNKKINSRILWQELTMIWKENWNILKKKIVLKNMSKFKL
jgi:hypothetical protein